MSVRALLTIEPVENDLRPARIDERLAAGYFPYGQRWMTCRAWPVRDASRDTVFVRVRLERRAAPPRWRAMQRAGCVSAVGEPQLFDEEHQRLYDRFRELRHPEWVEALPDLVLSDAESSRLLERTRELSIRDAEGRLLAFRWFVEGEAAIAGLTAIYDPSRSGHGSIARALADEWAAAAGFAWSYPGYVFPGHEESWAYKIKPGRTEWFDAVRECWRVWDSDEPRPEELLLPEIRRRLAQLGEVVHYPHWVIPYVVSAPLALRSPYFVVRAVDGDVVTMVVWDHETGRYEMLRAALRTATDEATDDDAGADAETSVGSQTRSK